MQFYFKNTTITAHFFTKKSTGTQRAEYFFLLTAIANQLCNTSLPGETDEDRNFEPKNACWKSRRMTTSKKTINDQRFKKDARKK